MVWKIRKFVKETDPATSTKSATSKGNLENASETEKFAHAIFIRYQTAWQNFDIADIRAFTTERYAKHAELMLAAMQQMHRQNTVSNIDLYGVEAKEDVDIMRVSFSGSADDGLINTVDSTEIYKNNVRFTEYWNFKKVDGEWKLDSIGQSTESTEMLHPELKQFADDNQMFYSPDWGGLLLPEGGALFRHGRSGADINNHVIGYWQNDLLLQLYTYSDTPNLQEDNYYLVGQIQLPKTYGGIAVLRTDTRNAVKKLKGYEVVQTEWGDFNQRYTVLATDRNQVVSLELLNPAFMAWLYDQDIHCNIEVLGNSVYFYSRVGVDAARYREMLEILKRSYKELKM